MTKIVRVTKEFTFDSAHFLKDYNGICENLHGHTYKMHVSVEGEVKPNGLVLDFAELKEIVKRKVICKLDHHNINDYLEHSTAENICMWTWDRLKEDLPGIVEVKVWETPTSFATYTGQ